mgnify:CR=1 FL=1
MTMGTLIAAGRLDERLLRAALVRLGGARLDAWVEPGSAADLESTLPAAAVRAAIAGWEEVDFIVHSAGPREKRLLVADMDSTMIGQECIDELADYAGIKPQIAAITERAMRGEIEFEPALRERMRRVEIDARRGESGIDIRIADTGQLTEEPANDVAVKTGTNGVTWRYS